MNDSDIKRADRPVSKIDFVNGQWAKLSATDPQPRNATLAGMGSLGIGEGAVMASSRQLVVEVLQNAGVYSSEDLIEQGNSRPLIPLGIDPPRHRDYRTLLNPLFSPALMEAQEENIAACANRFIDGFIDRGSCNFTAEFAELFPSAVFLGLMGMPWEELDTFVAMRDGLLHPGTADSTPEERLKIQTDTAAQVYDYFDKALDERAARPTSDILSELIAPSDGRDELSRDDALSICFVLLTAGLDTVTDSLTCFWAYLARHQDKRAELVDDPEVIASAVEELLRFETPVPSVVRWAKEEGQIGEHTVQAGHHVVVNLSTANLDAGEFPDPLTVDLSRKGNRHLAFGAGPHRCLGSHLARRELRIALREWHRRIPEYTLRAGYEVSYRPPLRFVPDLQLSWPMSGDK